MRKTRTIREKIKEARFKYFVFRCDFEKFEKQEFYENSVPLFSQPRFMNDTL